MPPRELLAHCDPLDLLRRFVATPLKAIYRIGGVRVMVQTNDFTLLPTLPSGASLDVTGNWDLEWKLVRDVDARGPLQPSITVDCRALTVVQMGSACLLGLDHERRELLAFIGADVDAHTHQDFLVPLLCQMTKEASAAERFSVPAGVEEQSGNG